MDTRSNMRITEKLYCIYGYLNGYILNVPQELYNTGNKITVKDGMTQKIHVEYNWYKQMAIG